MKRAFKSIACLIFMLSVLFSMASCSTPETGETSSGGDSNAVDDDFFVDNETPISGQEEQTGSTSQGTANSSNAPENSTAGTTSVPKENQIGGKSWEQVLASMPSKLKGTTVTMYNWNPASEYTGAPTVIQEFEEETGIKVEWNTVNFDVYVSRLASLIASGESPDLVRTRTPVPERLVSFQPLSAANFDFIVGVVLIHDPDRRNREMFRLVIDRCFGHVKPQREAGTGF